MRQCRRPNARRTLALTLTAGLALSLSPAVAGAAPHSGTYVIPSRSSQVGAALSVDPAGAVSLSVTGKGGQQLTTSTLGLKTTDADLTRGLRLNSTKNRQVNEHYRMTTGKRLDRSVRMSESRFSFTGDGNARLDIVVRLAPDGVAYRYELPGSATVTGEASSFTLPANAPAWLLPYNAQYENQRVQTTANSAATGDFGYPSLFQAGQEFVLLTESNVDGRYSGSRLRHTTGSNTYAVQLADSQVRSTGTTPWRTVIAGDLATVTESTLVDDLADPAEFTDTSWIHPGKVAWSWLSENSSPRDFERQKDYVDFAAANGWPYVLVDEGWSTQWVPELTRYARAKGVDILLWFHWTALDTKEKRQTVLPLVKSWGVKGVKIDFMESDSQARFQWYDETLADTAALKLMVNFHGATIPHGLARTWPHIMTMEAVRGTENQPPPAGNPIQTFTRNVVGSMDFTPVALDVGIKQASIAHEVALSVAFESGWQHFADKPEAYESHPEALKFLNQVPTVWDQTELLGGSPGQDAVLARRSGDRWFVGAIAAGEAKTLTASLSALGGGQWLADVVRDAPGTERTDVVHETSKLRSLSVAVPKNGGFAAVLCPARPGRTSCYEPIVEVPETTLTLNPAGPLDLRRGATFTVSAEFSVVSPRTVRDVELAPKAPAGWTVTGAPVKARSLGQGGKLAGTWTFKVPDTAFGTTEVPLATEFSDGTRRVHVEKAVRVTVPLSGTPYVSDLPFDGESNGYGPVERDRSNNDLAGGDGNPLTIGGTVYAKGIGTHAPSDVTLSLGGGCTSFDALVGLDDETTSDGSVSFQVLADGQVRYDSGVLRGKNPAIPAKADVTGARALVLRVTDGGDGKNFDHADWADARLTCAAA
jgi:alpha-glucosidase